MRRLALSAIALLIAAAAAAQTPQTQEVVIRESHTPGEPAVVAQIPVEVVQSIAAAMPPGTTEAQRRAAIKKAVAELVRSPLDVIADAKILVRKGFRSRTEERAPAEFTYQTSGEARDKRIVNIGVSRYFDTKLLQWAPSLEWHAVRERDKDANFGVGAINVDGVLGTGSVAPTFRGRAGINRDFTTDDSTGEAFALVGLFTEWKYGPGGPIRINGRFVGTYYPYVGLEYLNGADIGTLEDRNLSFAVARLETQIYPFNPPHRLNNAVSSPLNVTLEYTYRHPLDDRDELRNHYGLFVGDVNYFLDAKQRVSVGFTYQNGSDPDDDFASEHAGIVSLRLKI